MVRRALLPWYNSFKFFQTYAKVDGFSAKDLNIKSDNILDQWLISKLQTLITNVNREMQAYRLYNVVPELFNFIEDLTNWYIRLNRRRFWEDGNSADKKAAYATLYTTLENLSRLMAPFAPFLSEHIYQELKTFGGSCEESVHLCAYPEENKALINETLEVAVGRMQQVINLGRQKRVAEKVKVKTPLKTLKVLHQEAALLKEIAKLEEYIKIELNAKNVEYMTNEEDFVVLSAKANLPVLGKKLGKEMGKFKGMIESLSSNEVAKIEAGEKITLSGVEFDSEEILVFRNAKPGTQAVTNRFITIDLDCTLDQELIDEGLAREMVNRIQKSRKDSGFEVSDRIQVEIMTSPEYQSVFEKFKDYIQSETLTVKFAFNSNLANPMTHEIEEVPFAVKLTKA
jgi:isoleucyl-tRNA synthetase